MFYNIDVIRTQCVTVTIEAKNADEAIQIAQNRLLDNQYDFSQNDSQVEYEIFGEAEKEEDL